MSEPASQSEEKDAVENCIRSFIIKSIHAIVQARSGNVCTTDCISDVGARNNLMVFIEEDPEIGANIKQTLSAGFPIHVRDVLAVEILTKTPAGDCVHEVWRFRLDVDETLNDLASAGQPGEQRTQSAVHAGGDTSLQASTEVVVGDFKPARLFQQLGTLLKSIIVVARLLPAYRVSRGQIQTDYPMFYTLRRGFTDLARLGPEANCYEIGRLFSGLAVKQQQQQQPQTSGPPSSQPNRQPDELLPVFLQASVCHRTTFCQREASSIPAKARHTLRPTESPYFPVGMFNEGAGGNRLTPDPRLYHEKDVRAVFGEPHEPQELDDPAHQLLVAATAVQLADPSSDSGDDDLVSSLQPMRFPSSTCCGDHSQQGEREEYRFGGGGGEDEEGETLAGDSVVEGTAWPLANGYGATAATGDKAVRDCSSPRRRLADSEQQQQQQQKPSFAFSLLDMGGEQPTRLLAQIRETANLDLFKAPRSLSAVRTSQSSLFDPDALNEELERHERRLKEFDDFLADFVSVEPFAAAPPILATRGHYATEL